MSNGMGTATPGAELFVDRHEQQELFAEVLECRGSRRYLVFTEIRGNGKTSLLGQLWRNAFRDGRVSCLLPLDSKKLVHPVDVVTEIRSGLRTWGDLDPHFAEFDAAEEERWDRETRINVQASGSVDLHDADVHGSDIRITGAELHLPADQARRVDEAQRQKSVAAFVRNLRAIAQERTVALLVDAFNECRYPQVQTWIANEFLPQLITAALRPPRLVLVLAGESVPRLEGWLRPEELSDLVSAQTQLPHIGLEDFKELARAVTPGADESEIEWVWGRMRAGRATLLNAVGMLRLLQGPGEP